MIAEAWKDESAWFENTDGVQPVNNEILVDVVIDGEELFGDMADTWMWSEDGEGDITHWRLHKPLDVILPAPKTIPPMPACKPAKTTVSPSENTILSAFSSLTGVILTDDQFNTLKILMEHFSDV